DPRTEAFLGMVLLHSFDDKNRHCEVAFWLIAGARRHGLGTAVVTLMISWAMRELDVLRVELTTTPENAATQALADRLGFTREGVLRQRNIERGRRVDVVWYGLLREEWLS
ncbi:MAG: GNAT family N-acetyltransferase, partial [Actinobacteria bacterium]